MTQIRALRDSGEIDQIKEREIDEYCIPYNIVREKKQKNKEI